MCGMDSKEDSHLLVKRYFQSRSPEDFSLLVHAYSEFVQSVACQTTGRAGLAEDISQEVFLRLLVWEDVAVALGEPLRLTATDEARTGWACPAQARRPEDVQIKGHAILWPLVQSTEEDG